MKLYVNTAYLEPEHLIQVVRKAEEVGLYGATVADHLMLPKSLGSDYPYATEFPDAQPFPDTWVAIAAMAAATSTLRFASAVYLALLRPPVYVAKAVATAAILSDYRVALCIGLGWMREEYEHVQLDFSTRGKRHDEMVAVLREIWRGGWVDHHGEFYGYEPFQGSPAPKQHIPIWGAGHSDASLRRSARLDGWVGANAAIPDLFELVPKVRRYRREAVDDDKAEFEVMSGLKEMIPGADDIKRLEELGVTSLWIHPWAERNSDGDPGCDVVTESLERYAERVLAKL
jgi:probable F420-dependent oxidoreductase